MPRTLPVAPHLSLEELRALERASQVAFDRSAAGADHREFAGPGAMEIDESSGAPAGPPPSAQPGVRRGPVRQ